MNGDAHLILNSSGATYLAKAIGSVSPLKSITSDVDGFLLTAGAQYTIRVNGDDDTVINDLYRVGPSSRATWEQLGTGDLVFNNNVNQNSGSPQQLTIELTGGSDVHFNEDVLLGDLTVNGSGRVIANADVTTRDAGANQGHLQFNVPVVVKKDVTFKAENGIAKVSFNDALDDDGDNISSSHVTIDSANGLVLNDVGQSSPIISLTVQNATSTQLMGDITTETSQSWNVDVTQAADVAFTSTNSGVNFSGALDAAGFNTTLNQAANPFTIDTINISNPATLTIGPLGSSRLAADFTLPGDLVLLNQLDVAATSTLTVNGIEAQGVDLNNGDLTIDVSSDSSVINNQVTGNSGALIKDGTGTLYVAGGIDAGNTTLVLSGRLDTGGTHDDQVTVSNDATLGGFGHLTEAVNISTFGVVDPGQAAMVGQITFADLFYNSSDNATHIDIDGPLSTEHDQIILLDTLILNGQLTIGGNYSPLTGDTFTIIDNQNALPVIGTFVGLPEGSSPALGLEISYVGGDGNDVVLTTVCDALVTVTDAGDSGAGTLRQAFADLCDGGTIQFDPAVVQVNLTSSITVNKTAIINGNNTVVTGGGSSQVFHVQNGGDLTLNQLRVFDAYHGYGAIRNNGTLTVSGSYFSDNYSSGSGGLGGGAIINFGTADISQSSFYHNNASRGGALFNTDGATMTVSNTTFYENGNTESAEGGVIHNRGNVTFLNTTMVDSGDGDVGFGNTISNYGINASMSLINTVITSESQQTECVEPSDTNINVVNSFISDGSCNATFSGDPLLGDWIDASFGAIGHAAYVIPPLEGSPLINRGSNAECPTTDQLGTTRPLGTSCDIGAVEFIDTMPPEVTVVALDGSMLNSCDQQSSDQINVMSVSFSEAVLNAEDTNNYVLVHAGEDHNFGDSFRGGQSDDINYFPSAAVSDQNSPPTITLTFNETLESGLVRLYVNPSITDEFYNELNGGDDHYITFRIDANNLLRNAHFDDCDQGSVITDAWFYEAIAQNGTDDTEGSPPIFEEGDLDHDGSNHSKSLLIYTSTGFDYQMSQCANLVTDALPLEMEATVIFFPSGPPGVNAEDNSILGSSTADVTFWCEQWDQSDCMGNPINVMTETTQGVDALFTFVDVKSQLGMPDSQALSVNCGLGIRANDSNSENKFVDGVRLEQADLIFENGFEPEPIPCRLNGDQIEGCR